MNHPNLNKIFSYYQQNPLRTILIVAFVARLIAVFFAKGYMMHDDHFLTVEPASSWAVGKNFNDWLPGINNDRTSPEPISFFYLGFLFLFFKFFHLIGIENPDTQMYLIRLIQGSYSLLTILFAFRITELLSTRKNAITVGWLLALIAVMPNFGVRNLVELTCMPPLLGGFYILVKHYGFAKQTALFGNDTRQKYSPLNGWFLLAALVMGLAVGLRYQTGLLVALVGLVLFLQRGFLSAVVFGVVSFAAFFLTQIDDILLWGGKPFQHLQGYFEYNKENANNYPGSSLTYLSFITLYIFPPVSLFLLFGFFRTWKRHFIIFLPIAGFLLFHIVYPNRQERFILPALPFFVMLGTIGWSSFLEGSAFWKNNVRLLRGCLIFFWTINIAGMLVFSFTYSKRARVEAMLFIYQQGDCKNFVQEFTHADGASMPPQFYSGSWPTYYYWGKNTDVETISDSFETTAKEYASRLHTKEVPNYYLFYDKKDLEERVARIKRLEPSLEYVTTIEAGWYDKLLNSLNDKNALETIYIYKVK